MYLGGNVLNFELNSQDFVEKLNLLEKKLDATESFGLNATP